MSHFRLKRRVRRLVDSLSLRSSKVSAIYATPAFLLRAVLPHTASSGWQMTTRPRSLWPRLLAYRRHRFFKARVRSGRRKYLTMMLAMLVFSLQICGCELARDPGLPLDSSGSVNTVRGAAVLEPRLYFYGAVDGERGPSTAPVQGGAPLSLVRPASVEAKPIPWPIPESVFFVYEGGNGGADPGRHPIATAFVVSVPDREHRRAFRFLVTTRHVVDPLWAHCAERNPSTIDLRLNRRSGGVAYENVPLQSGHRRRFFTPTDPTADLAIIPLNQSLIPRLNDYKFIDVPFRMLPTGAEVLQFHADQPVMTARVRPWRSSDSGNFPMFDAGVLSKLPTEAVDVQCSAAPELQPPSKPLHVWFIDAGFAQGASGSPVYTAVMRSPDGAKTPVLLGIQSLAWPDRGAAGITPSFILGDLIQTYLRESGARMDFYKGPSPWAKDRAPSLY